MKAKLIEDWKQSWKFLSVQLAVALALLDTAYEYLPAIQSYLPVGWVKWMALAIIVGRIIKQQKDVQNADS